MSISDIPKKYRNTNMTKSKTLQGLAPPGRHVAKVTGWGGYYGKNATFVYWITMDLEGGHPYLALAQSQNKTEQIRIALEGQQSVLWRRQNYLAFLMHNMAIFGSDREIASVEHMEFFVDRFIDPRQAAKVPPLEVGIGHIGVARIPGVNFPVEVCLSQAEFEGDVEFHAIITFMHQQEKGKNLIQETWKEIKKQNNRS